MRNRLCNSIALAFVLSALCSAADELNFNHDIRPLLSEKCFHCHGPDPATREADLRLDQKDSAMSVIASKDLDASELIQRILSDDPDQRMPPPDSGKELNAQEIQSLKKWVSEGAEYQGHWSFQPLTKPAPPNFDSPWIQGAIDQFVYRSLKSNQLEPSPIANRETLIRRVTLDLTGLPPTLQEIDDFLADKNPNAYESLIDRLMQSPRYGEQMALPWLEASRYADTDGYQNDRYRYHHVWRDWVITAFNQNMPYDQFVIEQLAGDMLPEATLTQQIATGFGRNHRINSEDGSIPEEWRVANVVDRVDTFGTVFLGLTIECSRCHDHKYDPISQKDYYQLFAYFNNIAEWGVGPNNGNSPPFIDVPKSWPNISDKENQLIIPDPVELHSARKTEGNGLKRPQAGAPSTLMVMHELPEPRDTYILVRGQYDAPDKAEKLTPGVPDALNSGDVKTAPTRLGLAKWLVDQNNPLTARVAVNRMWQHFFGVGIVATSENFGSQGTPPTHPQLLDWLSVRLIESGWDLREIQKLILLSSTYRQSSVTTAHALTSDPKNLWLSHAPRVRLPGFTLRDQALCASGLLVDRIGGPSTKPYMPPKIWRAISNNIYKQDNGVNLYRRSLYTYWRRTIPPPTMMTFNAASREVCMVRTEKTNTPLQALTLMNNDIFVESARFLAERMIRESNPVPVDQINHGFRIICSRLPTAGERSVLQKAHQRFIKHFRNDKAAAQKLLATGKAKRDIGLDAADHAAMTMVASLIMNLDEAITKD